MPRLLGVNIPDNKRIEVSLTYIYGIGPSLSRKLLKETKIDPDRRANQLNSRELNQLKEAIEKNHQIEGGLRREVMMNIKRLKDLGTWRGMRHIRGLPVRGQTTRINSRTVRGNLRKTVGSGRKPPPTPK